MILSALPSFCDAAALTAVVAYPVFEMNQRSAARLGRALTLLAYLKMVVVVLFLFFLVGVIVYLLRSH